jgi:putative PEP-CTERM system histidine kinase
MAARAPWLVVPLVHREQLLGFTLLQHSRAPRQLDHEDRDLLGPIGRQAAGVLAEHRAQRALDDSREIDLFNRRFAFVVHDVKTITSQMSLLLANADKHGRNPAFQSDLIASIGDSVRSMRRLLGQINAERDRSARPGSLDLVPLVGRLVEQRVDDRRIRFDCALPRLHVNADERSMTAVVGHLLQNAVEAATDLVRIKLASAADGTRAVIEVEDDGPGMDADFVRDRLFRPLVSTKAGGFGIGAYQCRELTRDLGGWLTVSSTPGKGTTMRVTFPLAESAPIQQPRAAASL